MSDGRSFAEMLVSELGTPRDHTAELLGMALVLLLVLAYLALEYGVGRALLRGVRAIKAKLARRSEAP